MERAGLLAAAVWSLSSIIWAGGAPPVVLLVLAAAGSGLGEGQAPGGPGTAAGPVTIGGLSFSLPPGFAPAAYEESREPQRDIPGQFVDQVFASWEGPGGERFTLFYWSPHPPRDLGPMAAARRWKRTIAGREAEVAETTTFMGIPQRVLVTWLERPDRAGRFMMYARNMPQGTFEAILATMSFLSHPS
jgi:hypothetical protein